MNKSRLGWGSLGFAVCALVAACVGDEADTNGGGNDAGSDGATSDGGGGDSGGDARACTTCGSSCVDLTSDNGNCGACGHACKGSYTCGDSHCGDDVADVASGSYFSCALLHDGTVWCWGDNQSGELGHDPASDPTCDWNNGSAQSTPCNATPTQVGSLTGVAQVSAGHGFACATLKADGSVWCWGLNDHGETGATAGSPFVPSKVGSLTDVVQISAGLQMACGVTKTGTVYCWGRDIGGGFGNGTGGDVDQSSPTPTLANVANVKEVAVHSNVCALLQDGTVSCWGQNQYGSLGHDPDSPDASPSDVDCHDAVYAFAFCNPTPQTIPNLTGVAHVFANGLAFCAVKADQTVYCWGYDGQGNYSDGDVRNSTPGPGTSNGNLNLATLPQTVAGAGFDAHGCAIASDGHVWCWGSYLDGELGIGSTDAGVLGRACIAESCVPTAVQLTAPADFASQKMVKVSGSGWIYEPSGIMSGNTMVLGADGSVWAWGDNRFGQLGHSPGGADGGSGDVICTPGSCGVSPVRMTSLP